MSVRGLVPQTIAIPLAAGLQTKQDVRAVEPPGLLICRDAQFDELGGLQLRKPYEALNLVPFGGGSITNPRKVVAYGDELLLFTKDSLYSRVDGASTWALRGTHLAVELAETPRFVTTDDQIAPDRAELNGVVFVSWHKVVSGNTYGYVAAYDKATGAVLLAPYELAGFQRIRLTALTSKVLLSFFDGINGVYCYALDPASPTTALGGASTTVQSGTGTGVHFDVVKVPGADQAVFGIRRQVTTSYDVVTMTGGLVAARSNKARVCDGPIAVSCPPTGTHVQIVRANGSNVQGDLILISGLTDVYTAQAIGSAGGAGIPFAQIAAAHRSVQDSSVYRCYVFWSASEASDDTDFETTSNWVSTGNTLGTAATFVRRLGVASRAFDHDGRVFVWTAYAGASVFGGSNDPRFGAQLQNTYFLYRDDALLTAKAARFNAGGFAALTGHLPDVQALGSGVYAMAGTERRIIQLGEKQSGYGARAPREIVATFDSDTARRCVQLGQTLYVTGGELLQYDGVRLTEAGYHLYPSYFEANSTVTGSMAVGSYTYKLTWRWDNATGEIDRSTTATTVAAETIVGRLGMAIAPSVPLYVTHKTENELAVEVWRTPVNPLDDSPFYLVTSKDPASLTNPNRYLPNLRTAATLATFNDELNDSDATTRESSPENYGVLEFLAPPACTIIAANADRLFLGGVAGDPHRVWYSRLRGDNEIASFNDALVAALPTTGGVITGLAFLNETLVVFKERAIYALPGDGYDNTGGGSNYGPARLLSSDVGAVNHESIALTPQGLVFKSRKGWYLLGGGWGLQYIGAPVADFDTDTIVAVHVLEAQHQVRCLSAGRCLVWDYLAGQWSEWTITGGLGATMWGGSYVYVTSAGVFAEASDYSAGVTYGLDIETAWIPMGQIQGFGRVWKVLILGEYRGDHAVRVRISKDYASTHFHEKVWDPSPTAVGEPEQIEHGPSIQEMQAIKIRLTVGDIFVPEGGGASSFVAASTEGLKLTSLALELGLERGLHRLPAAQRQ
jgi:hypothetical protein